MMETQELADEVLQLTLAWQQGQISVEERARLERVLADSAEARRIYVAIVDDTVAICEFAAAEREAQSAVEAKEVEMGPRRRGLLSRAWFSSPKAMVGRVFAGSAAAAAGLLAITYAGLWMGSDTNQELSAPVSTPLAKVVSISGAQWSTDATKFTEWSHVHAGDSLRLDSGMLELVIDGSIQLILEGPADLHLVSRRKAIARQGKFVARVGPDGAGFEIETPQANVIDRGTSFGITIAKNGQTDVVVYEGTVDLSMRQQTGIHQSRRLATGEALRIDAHGILNRITSVGDESFLPPPKVGSVTINRPRLITSVTDNVSLLDTAKYYRIVGGGMGEDSAAYVDRLHEWNGIDHRGIPPFLQRADYVMTFNDDKIVTDLQVVVGLAQPATLYILWDDRVAKPKWLIQRFADTGWSIGLDEGFPNGDVTGSTTGAGAGTSVDQVFSVWRQHVPEPRNVELGPVRSEATSLEPLEVPASMYGIAATPILGQMIDAAE